MTHDPTTHLPGLASPPFDLYLSLSLFYSLLVAMEGSSGPSWEQRIHALTHILTHPTTAPSLHSQLFVASHVPCFLRWDYPPFLCPSSSSFPSPLLRWSFSVFLSRAARLGLPRSSWRSKCPFQQPPPLILSSAVDAAPPRWGPEERRAYFRRRLRRGRLGFRVPPILVFALPNLALLSLLFFDPTWLCRWT